MLTNNGGIKMSLNPDSTLCCPHCLKPVFDDDEPVRGYIFRHNVLVDPSGREIKLYSSGLLLLKLLLKRAGQPIPHEIILSFMYGAEEDGGAGIWSVRVNVSKLRKMIRKHKLPMKLVTLFRYGYKIELTKEVPHEQRAVKAQGRVARPGPLYRNGALQ
jgi:DNA-binding winged helix-turn-helix (wHTH) protein